MTLFLMPTVYAVLNKRSEERTAKARVRRERIASGEGRVKRKDIAAASIASTVGTVISETEGDI